MGVMQWNQMVSVSKWSGVEKGDESEKIPHTQVFIAKT